MREMQHETNQAINELETLLARIPALENVGEKESPDDRLPAVLTKVLRCFSDRLGEIEAHLGIKD